MHGSTLIVTGSTGIAAATARLAGRAGARLAIATAESDSGWPLAAETGAECAGSGAHPELSHIIQKKQPLTGDMVDAQEVARAALILLSEEARPITGEVLTVDAGWAVTNS